jgi:hypothetical protein
MKSDEVKAIEGAGKDVAKAVSDGAADISKAISRAAALISQAIVQPRSYEVRESSWHQGEE